MAKNSKIEWTHHTFNPWWGCTKVSAACRHCYAESWAKRVGSDVWGAKAARRFFGENHWRQPLLWNREAEKERQRRRVFCASMADVFEDREELHEWRSRLWDTIEATPWLDWLLLTKRPELVGRFVPWDSKWPRNIWLGTTVETQKWADRRLPALLAYPAFIRFISCEPLLGPLDLRPWLDREPNRGSGPSSYSIDWVIAGGESGHRARPMHPAWLQDLRNQCVSSGVPFHFKQWGNWRPDATSLNGKHRTIQIKDPNDNSVMLVNIGKSAAGRDLDGHIWDELPDLIGAGDVDKELSFNV